MKIIFPTLIAVNSPDQFEARDDHTFAINMPAPNAMLLDVVTLGNNALLDPEEVKAHATAKIRGPPNGSNAIPQVWVRTAWCAMSRGLRLCWKQRPSIGEGLHISSAWSPNIRPTRPIAFCCSSVRRSTWWSGPNSMSPKNLKSLEGEPDSRSFRFPTRIAISYAMNMKKAPFDNVNVRRAINYAIPIQAIIPNVLYGFGDQMKSPVPSQTPGFDGTLSPYKYDIEKAKALMQQAGRGPGPIPVTLAVRLGYDPHEQAAIWIQRDLNKIGFQVDIVKETDATFRQLSSNGQHQLSVRVVAIVDQ